MAGIASWWSQNWEELFINMWPLTGWCSLILNVTQSAALWKAFSHHRTDAILMRTNQHFSTLFSLTFGLQLLIDSMFPLNPFHQSSILLAPAAENRACCVAWTCYGLKSCSCSTRSINSESECCWQPPERNKCLSYSLQHQQTHPCPIFSCICIMGCDVFSIFMYLP